MDLPYNFDSKNIEGITMAFKGSLVVYKFPLVTREDSPNGTLVSQIIVYPQIIMYSEILGLDTRVVTILLFGSVLDI